MKRISLLILLVTVSLVSFSQSWLKSHPQATSNSDTSYIWIEEDHEDSTLFILTKNLRTGYSNTSSTLQGKDTAAIETDYRAAIGDSTLWWLDTDTIKGKHDNVRITELDADNSVDASTNNLNWGDQTFDTADIYRAIADMVEVQDTLIHEMTNGEVKVYADADTLIFYNDLALEEQIKLYPDGTTEFKDIKTDTIRQFYKYVAQFHRLDSINTTNTDENYIKWDTKVEKETRGNWKFTADSTGIYAPDSAIYKFTGCVHVVNNSGGSLDADVMCYHFVGGDTATCGQVLFTFYKTDGQHDQKTFTGTINMSPNIPFRMVYKVDDLGIDFDSGTLPKQVAISINFSKISD